eukprot:CAMPEP_0202713182 /NCGR_PEP_ID=MMETSP1385-20130828/51231_1 /ASSEMBLY_ACC=CAM_ASM_000861 /TAXON_ID=933848 /ORGANISM="Elphidium margaritaceum" /LENGTH=161 /DNA_ID=CAMNT_0049373455 /DNA_START=128 /DNA_END=613 /DNA_ORIENTATION=+
MHVLERAPSRSFHDVAESFYLGGVIESDDEIDLKLMDMEADSDFVQLCCLSRVSVWEDYPHAVCCVREHPPLSPRQHLSFWTTQARESETGVSLSLNLTPQGYREVFEMLEPEQLSAAVPVYFEVVDPELLSLPASSSGSTQSNGCDLFDAFVCDCNGHSN